MPIENGNLCAGTKITVQNNSINIVNENYSNKLKCIIQNQQKVLKLKTKLEILLGKM